MGNMVENMTPEMAMGMLKYIQSNDIIDLSYVQEMKEMAERDKYLQQHPYKIWQGKDGKWRTYLPDETKANGRKLIKRTSEEDIKKEVAKYYRKEAENPTIQEVFEEWNDRRLQLGKIMPATHERNCQTFKRHYSEIGEMRIKQVDADKFCDFLEEQISEKQLTAKAFSNLKSITKGFLKRAKKRKLIQYNVEEMMQDMDTSDSVFRRNIKEEDEVVFNEDELPRYIECLEKDMDLKNLGILLMFLTGIRVGELVALKHSDFDGNTIKIRRTETRVLIEKGKYDYRIKEFPKTQAGVRTVIIPKDYTWVAQKLKLSNPFQEYIFVTDAGKRMTTNVIRRRMERTCKKAKIKPKSPHKARRTFASILLDNNVDERMVIDLMGHTDIKCTEGYYHKNRRSVDKKEEILSSIPDFRIDKM